MPFRLQDSDSCSNISMGSKSTVDVITPEYIVDWKLTISSSAMIERAGKSTFRDLRATTHPNVFYLLAFDEYTLLLRAGKTHLFLNGDN